MQRLPVGSRAARRAMDDDDVESSTASGSQSSPAKPLSATVNTSDIRLFELNFNVIQRIGEGAGGALCSVSSTTSRR
ncbi:hypothetical protein STCU_12166 [Strigomonas culicis]|uniref:Uncharacterized protein n=1 Tax=Strigomonas culicis TaxID=28005 RepID=S9UXL4_9TRYP|nr:hypothetical protein STCU_12166 [Strigomonas culicis]|eukprot:EPY15280.1 hypothetical protein STCU_12166 [Strigomonas culicis]